VAAAAAGAAGGGEAGGSPERAPMARACKQPPGSGARAGPGTVRTGCSAGSRLADGERRMLGVLGEGIGMGWWEMGWEWDGGCTGEWDGGCVLGEGMGMG